MRKLLFGTLLTTLLGSMLVYLPNAFANEHAMQGKHGMGMMHGKGHGMHDDNWHDSLSEEQQKQVDKLHLDFLQKTAPLKAKIKAAKIDLALLTTADKPNQKDIDKKIEEITKLKGEKMRLKAAHHIEVRKLLTAEQRVQFDLHILQKASKGHQRGGHH